MPYEYHTVVKEIIDGDTILVDVDLGFDVKLTNQKIRLFGIDTPESRTTDKLEKVFGLVSKEYTKKFIDNCSGSIILRTHSVDNVSDREKFGRLLGEVINPTTTVILNNLLVTDGYAVKYVGDNKANLKPYHMQNRKRLIDEGVVSMSYHDAGLIL